MPRTKRAARPGPPAAPEGAVWYLIPGVGPRPSGAMKGALSEKASHWCREGDAAWTPIVREEPTTPGDAP